MRIFLDTDRLILRRFTDTDADLLIDLDSDPEVMRFLTGGVPTPPERIRDEVLPRLLGYYQRWPRLGTWAAIEKSTDEFVGWFAMRPNDGDEPGNVEIGYRLRRSMWGRGYATECSAALIHKGFTELGVTRVYARTMAVNTRSRHVMEKLGLTLARTFRLEFDDPIDGSEHGEVEYELLANGVADRDEPRLGHA